MSRYIIHSLNALYGRLQGIYRAFNPNQEKNFSFKNDPTETDVSTVDNCRIWQEPPGCEIETPNAALKITPAEGCRGRNVKLYLLFSDYCQLGYFCGDPSVAVFKTNSIICKVWKTSMAIDSTAIFFSNCQKLKRLDFLLLGPGSQIFCYDINRSQDHLVRTPIERLRLKSFSFVLNPRLFVQNIRWRGFFAKWVANCKLAIIPYFVHRIIAPSPVFIVRRKMLPILSIYDAQGPACPYSPAF